MNPLLEQFLSEARDFLQGIGEKLMQLEKAPDDAELMTELFRFVHTLKGNSGLFDFPEMTRVLHAGEDLMDAVRHGRVAYSQELADRLLDAMDFVGMLCDEIEAQGMVGTTYAADSARLAESLRQMNASAENVGQSEQSTPVAPAAAQRLALPLDAIPETLRMAAYRSVRDGQSLHWLEYTPAEDCFFSGDDPFFQARQTPEALWGGIVARAPWPKLPELDAYRCLLDFHVLSTAPQASLEEYYRYMSEQIRIESVAALALVVPQGDLNGGPVYEDFVVEALDILRSGDLEGLARAAQTMLDLSNPDLWLSSALRWLLLLIECEPENHAALAAVIESLRHQSAIDWSLLESAATRDADGQEQNKSPLTYAESGNLPPSDAAGAMGETKEIGEIEEIQETGDSLSPPSETRLSVVESATLAAIVATQREILSLPVNTDWQLGRIKAASAALAGCLRACGQNAALPTLDSATATALDKATAEPLLAWLDRQFFPATVAAEATENPRVPSAPLAEESNNAADEVADEADDTKTVSDSKTVGDIKFGRRADDVVVGPKSLKVDQVKIDRLMNLIGEIVVAKNALPYLAGRAETVFGVRELAREIKAQYAVINRIAEELQDGIMQIRMMPVSFVFQRFPRLVRDISRKLGKEVSLVLEGEETEADKNIIESLGDPLVHIVRNSLDHGFELPDVRRAAGKPATGTLTIRATQESDRVVIEIQDDGKGIDPTVVKRKAYEKGLIDEATLERMSDQEAVNLVFAAGFSTVEEISDLSGRGVGMDVVRTAVEKVNGNIALESVKGQGTLLRLSLPLSMAITNVMIVESDGQLFGMPMDCVAETVRVPRSDIRTIKKTLATVLRGRIVPLKSINSLLGLSAPPLANEQNELAVLVVRLGGESVGLLVDNFRETVDIILKPLTGVLAGLTAYSGSALMGDGSVLMVLNVKELL